MILLSILNFGFIVSDIFSCESYINHFSFVIILEGLGLISTYFSVETWDRHEGEANERLIDSQSLCKSHLVILILRIYGR